MTEQTDIITLAAELTAAWLGNPHTRATADDVPAFLLSMHKAVADLGQSGGAATEPEQPESYVPSVSARKSLASPDHIVSMIDGKKYRSLTRHLSSKGLTPAEYRERYNLKSDYPMVAPAYSEARRTIAKARGLGRKAGAKIEQAAEDAAKTVKKSGKAALAAAKKTLGTDKVSIAADTLQR